MSQFSFLGSALSKFSHVSFFSYKDIKSGQSPLMHAVETNNADMVYFLIEVKSGRGGKDCDSALFNKFSFLFSTHKLCHESAILLEATNKND